MKKKEKLYTRLTIDIPTNDFVAFKRACQASGKSMSEVLRYAITGIVQSFSKKIKVKTQKEAKEVLVETDSDH